MTRSALGIAALCAIGLATAGTMPGATADARRRDHRDHRADRYRLEAERYKAAYEEAIAGLDRIERINAQRHTRRTPRRIQRTIDATRRRALAYAEPPYPTEPAVVVPVAPVEPAPVFEIEVMDAQRFGALRAAVDDASFAREQVAVVVEAAAHNWFTVDQVINLMGEVSFASTKVDVAAALYPRVVDHAEWYRVYSALDFDSSRSKLRKRVRGIKVQTPSY